MASLYTILFSNGLIKVGMTNGNPRNRLSSHAASLGVANVDVVDYEFAKCQEHEVMNAEKMLIEYCKAQSGVVQKSKEWFYGLDFCSVASAMQELAQKTDPSLDSHKIDKVIHSAESSKILREAAMDVVQCATTMSILDDDVVKAVLGGMSRSRARMMIDCWEFIAARSAKGIVTEDDLLDLIDVVSRELTLDFICPNP